jgi:hypothetical protein
VQNAGTDTERHEFPSEQIDVRSGTDTDAAARLGGGVEPPGDPKFGVLPPRRDYAVQVNDEPADWGIDDVLDALRRGIRGTTEERDSDQ